jgi:hypothetical protein
MTVYVSYPHDPSTGVPRSLTARHIWAVAAQVRAAVARPEGHWSVEREALVQATTRLDINSRRVASEWDFAHEVHDEEGSPVFGICETDPTVPGVALVSVNTRALMGRPELTLSTAAHELGHVVFDVPSVLDQPERRYRSVTSGAASLDRATELSERRANEFMGAVLVPAAPLHLRLVKHARAERLRMVHAANFGRPGLRVIGAGAEAAELAGIVAVLASEFGVSDTFIRVRMDRYRLIEGGWL